MEIKFTGTGGAFDYSYGNSSAILYFNNKKILIDCGNSVYYFMRNKKIIEVPDHIMITHFHDDHIGSLSSILLHHKIFLNKKLKIIYPEEHFRDEMKKLLSFSLNDAEKYADFIPAEEINGIHYINTKGKHVPWMQTYAYYFETDGRRLVYSGDLAECEVLFDYLQKLDEMKTIVFLDISFEKANRAHIFYKDAEKYCDRFIIYGYHNDAEKKPADCKIPLVFDTPQYLMQS